MTQVAFPGLRTPKVRRILLYLHGHPDCTPRGLRDALGLGSATARRYCDALQAQGALDTKATGRGVALTLSHRGRELLQQLQGVHTLEAVRHPAADLDSSSPFSPFSRFTPNTGSAA